MSANFPSSLPAAGTASSSATLAAAGHTALHNNLADEVRALGTKVGVDGSAITTSLDYKLSGVTGTDKAASLSGNETLANKIINGSTINSATITAPSVTGGATIAGGLTVTGGGSWTGGPTISAAALTSSPTLTTPNIASFTNAQHNHTTSATGGKIGTVDYSSTTISNPYKFRVYRNAAANTGNGAFAVIAHDTEDYDTNNNVLSGVYTVPVTGYYYFGWSMSVTTGGAGETVIISLFRTGVEISRPPVVVTQGANAVSLYGSDVVFCTVGDTMDIRAFDGTAARALNVGTGISNFFTGFLMSTS